MGLSSSQINVQTMADVSRALKSLSDEVSALKAEVKELKKGK